MNFGSSTGTRPPNNRDCSLSSAQRGKHLLKVPMASSNKSGHNCEITLNFQKETNSNGYKCSSLTLTTVPVRNEML